MRFGTLYQFKVHWSSFPFAQCTIKYVLVFNEQLIEKIKNARPLEFESVEEDYEAENQASFEEELDFEVSKQPENFDILKSKISEKMKELELSVDHEIDESNPIICLTAEVDVDVTDNQAIFSTSKISRESFEGRK